jgi:formylglycine-generating enzyme required for sulfatase activity
MVFIPPGTFRMGSPVNEVDQYDWEGPQTAGSCSIYKGLLRARTA